MSTDSSGQGERPSLEGRIRARAQREPDFRAALLADPKAVVAAELEIEIPPSVGVRVVEERPAEVVIVIPPASASNSAVEDARLEEVAGAGWSGWPATDYCCDSINTGC